MSLAAWIISGAVALGPFAPADGAARKTFIPCQSSGGEPAEMKLYVKPHSCSTQQRDQDITEALFLRDLRWTDWGEPAATAKGKTRDRGGMPSEKVKVRAYRRINCPKGLIYSRIRVVAEGTTAVSLPTC